jgi:hypothetical protein
MSDQTAVCIMQTRLASEQLMLHIHANWAEECHDAEASKDTGYRCNYCLPDWNCIFWNANKIWEQLIEINGGTYVEK